MVENFIYCMNAIELAGGDREIVPVLGVFLVRSLVGLWSHATYTAIAGYGVGYFVTRTDRSLAARTGAVVLAFALAFAAHFVWNSPLLTEAFGEGCGILLGTGAQGHPGPRAARRDVPVGPRPGGDVVPRGHRGRGRHRRPPAATSSTS